MLKNSGDRKNCFDSVALILFASLVLLWSTAWADTALIDPLTLVRPELKTVLQNRPQMQANPQAVQAAVEKMIPGPKDAPDVKVFVINGGLKDKPRPAILHMHGGGYIFGNAESNISFLQPLADALDCIIVTVDYLLAPATKFPGSLEDNYAALKWVHQNAEELGIDRSRIAVMGESAGGGHAAMLAIAARNRGEVPIIYQALIYPMIDDRTGSTQKVPAHIGTFIWSRELNVRGWSALLGIPAGSAAVPEGAVPARVENLAGLPPAFIGVGSLDLFVEEDIAYAQRLIKAGIPVELNVVPGAFHAFDMFAPDASVTKKFRSALISALEDAFKR